MIDGVVQPVRRFLAWWGRELADLVPGALRPAGGARGPRTVIAVDKSTLQLIEERNRASRVLATAEMAGDGARKDPLSVLDPFDCKGTLGLRVPFEACFARSLHIPAAAVADAAAVAALDLERATPFRAADVLTAVIVDRTAGPVRGAVAIRQLVLKRETVRPLLASLAARGLEAHFIECWNADRSAAMPFDFMAAERAGVVGSRRPRRRLDAALAAAAMLGVVTAFGAVLVKHANARTVLDQETKAARQAAAGVGERMARAEAAIADVARLRGVKALRPAAVAVLDEVTRLLPDDVYLTELSLDGDQLDLGGFAVSAAPLLELFERSQQFTDARFSAPFRFDPRQERERFSLRVRVKDGRAAQALGPKEERK